jgi:serine/threonine protein kinase/transcriptional regulator with XRE-family HTH domain
MNVELQPGDPERIGPYRLLGRLGSGGMGRVFLARSQGGRLIAVKVIHPQLALDEKFRALFRREVAAARKVSGMFTALLVDADVDGPEPWLATAYVAGPSLAALVADHGPLPTRSLPTLLAGLAEGLQAIHAAGVVHRDLKPSNVLVAEDGPRVIDFGISRALESTSLTETGAIVGSPGFLSPEQATGDPVGPPSDVFSLGSLLVFAATGQSPFGTGTASSLLYRVVHGDPDLTGVPDNIRPLVARCLAKDPSARPAIKDLFPELGEHAASPEWLPFAVSGSGPAQVSTPTIITRIPVAPPISGETTFITDDVPVGDSGPVVDPNSIMTRGDFAQALRALCRHANLTVQEVATEARLSASTVKSYFRGDRLPASMGALGFILVACQVDDERQWEGWERAFRRVRALPQDHQTRSRAKPAAFQDTDQPDLLLSIYIPIEQLYAAEQRRVLSLFRDWLTRTRKHGIRQSERSTARGTMFEYYADGSVSLPELRAEIDVFAHFLNVCAHSPAAALDVLGETQIGSAAATELVTQFGKEVRRVEVDARHARERGMLTLKQTLENTLLETGVDLRAVPGAQVDAMLEKLVPYPNAPVSLPALAGPPVIHLAPNANVTVHQKIFSAMEQTIIEHVQGTVNLGAQAKEILALIDRFAGYAAPALTTAVHELEDPDAPPASRKAAKIKLKEFLAQLGGKIEDIALSVLEKYIESKIGM